MDVYDIFFSVCLGLFIGGLIFSIVSLFLARMEAQSMGQEIDTDVDIDAEVEVDYDMGAEVDGIETELEVEVDVDAEVEVEIDTEVELDIDTEVEIDFDSDVDIEVDAIGTSTTPAPFMLLITAFCFAFGATGILMYFIIIFPEIRFIMFIITPIIGILAARYTNVLWKKIAKSQYYKISTTQNLIGKTGEVVLPIDDRGGVIKINSSTPMKYEKVHVKPFDDSMSYDRGMKDYIVDVKDDFLLVDTNKNLIKKRRK